MIFKAKLLKDVTLPKLALNGKTLKEVDIAMSCGGTTKRLL